MPSLNTLVAWEKPGLGMEGSHRVVLFLKKEVAHSCVSSTEYRSGWIHACLRVRT